MQPVRTTIVDVSRTLATAVSAHSEAELPSPCTMYTLGPHPLRYAIPLAVLREQLIQHAKNVSGLLVCEMMPAFRPCPVLCLKNLFGESGEIALRCRVCFDVDTEGDGPPCAPSHLVDLFCSFLQTRLVGAPDLTTQPVWVWYGSFADKRASYHVYFPTIVWSRDTSNVYKDNDFTELQIQLDTFGLKLDTSITTSGIKVLGADKWIAQEKRWRGDVQRLVYVRFMEGVSSVTWEEAFAHCFAVAMPGDIGYDCQVKFRQIPRATIDGDAVAKRPRNFTEVRVAAPGPVASTPDTRLIAAVPEWRDARFKYVHKDNGVVFVIPQSTHCPLKSEPSDNQPAFVHAMPGKTYVIRDVLGEQRVKCHVCSGKELLIPVPVVEASEQIERELMVHFADWARFTPGLVVQLSTICSRDPRGGKFSYQAFIKHHERHGQVVKYGKRSLSWPAYWLGMDTIPNYHRGFIFDPSGSPPPGYLNIYTGYAPELQAAYARRAREFESMTNEQLLACVPNWHTVIQRNICRDDPALLSYFHNWMADLIQNPCKRPGVAMVIIGEPGCGKGLAFRPLSLIYGPFACQTNDLATKWTAEFVDKMFVYADEALAPKDKGARQRLLSLITETGIVTEQKGERRVMSDLFCRIGITSNRIKAVPVQSGERRYAFLGADFVAHPARSPEATEMFRRAFEDEIGNWDALAALLEFWQRRDLTGVNLRNVLPTSLTWEAQYAQMDKYEKWLYHWLRTGNVTQRELVELEPNELGVITAVCEESARFHGHPQKEAERAGLNVWECARCRLPKFVFALGMSQMFPEVSHCETPLWTFLHKFTKDSEPPLYSESRIRVAVGGKADTRVFVISLRALDEWRATFLRHRGGGIDDRIWDQWAIRI